MHSHPCGSEGKGEDVKVKGKLIKLGVLSGALVLFSALLGNWLAGDLTGIGDQLILAKPAFAQAAEASFLEQEAGIAAYVNVGHILDLAKAKAAYRTVEKETQNYIVGSVALPDYPASEDIHVYIGREGWIVAYYMKDEPTSKIIDWLNYSPGKINTKLKLGLAVIGNFVGVAITNPGYYAFNYPTANKLMLVVDSDEFRLTIPSGIMVFERSAFAVDKEVKDFDKTWLAYVNISSSLLSRDVAHVVRNVVRMGGDGILIDGAEVIDSGWGYVTIDSFGVALVYREP